MQPCFSTFPSNSLSTEAWALVCAVKRSQPGVPRKDWFHQVVWCHSTAKHLLDMFIPKADVLRGANVLAQNVGLVAPGLEMWTEYTGVQ